MDLGARLKEQVQAKKAQIEAEEEVEEDTESDEDPDDQNVKEDDVKEKVWRRISRWRRREVTYSKLPINEYQFTQHDFEEGYFKDILNRANRYDQIRMPKCMGREPKH